MSIRRNYTAREVMALPQEDLWNLPMGGLYLSFDNGETHKLKTSSTIYSSYYWRLVNMSPMAQITLEHHMGNGNYQAGTHLEIASKIFFDVYFSHPNKGQALFWHMSREICRITNEIYNAGVINLAAYVGTLSLHDVMEIQLDATVMAAKALYRKGEINVGETHNQIYKLMGSNKPSLIANEIRRATAAKLLSRRQITQMIGPRGNIPDINGETFPHPIDPGYNEGLTSFYDSSIESRCASIALYMTSGPLEASEYNNRQCQLCCSVFREITYGLEGDCGGEFTVPWVVQEDHLENLAGKFHMIDGKAIMIDGKDKNLIGKSIFIRSIATCSNQDGGTACQTCVGFTALGVPPRSNAGHHLAIDPQGQISQTILSTKHVIANAVALSMGLTGGRVKYFRLDEDDRFQVMLRKQKGKFKIRLLSSEALFINDIFQVDNIVDLNINGVTDIETLQFMHMSEDGTAQDIASIDVRVGGKGSPFSHEMLDYIRQKRWAVLGKYIEIDMADWNYEAPIIRTKPVSEDIMAVFESFKRFLHAPDKSPSAKITDYTTPGPAILALLNILKDKININFSGVEVFVRPLMCRGSEGHALPTGGEKFRFVALREAVMSRGIGSSLAFEEQNQLILSPASFNRRSADIPTSPMDDLWSTSTP